MNAQEIIDRVEQLINQRRPYETSWDQVSQVAFASAPYSFQQSRHGVHGTGHYTEWQQSEAARVKKNTRTRYSSAMSQANVRLSAGIISLTAPDGEQWHGLGAQGIDEEHDLEENQYLEKLTDFLFDGVRHKPDARFAPAYNAAIKSMVTYGAGFMHPEPGFKNALIKYRNLPLNECYIDKDVYGTTDTFARHRYLSARQAAQRFKDLPKKIQDYANDSKKAHEKFEFIQLISPNLEKKVTPIKSVFSMEYSSVHVAVSEKMIVETSGFDEFPVIPFFWDDTQGDLYGSSPCIEYMIEQQMLNAMTKSQIRAMQKVADPALMVHDDGLMNRVNQNPNAVNYGAMTADGRPLIAALNTGARPDLAQNFIEGQKANINSGMYVDLFRALLDRPNGTATEALLIAQEKADLLGPVGTNLKHTKHMLVDREMSILADRGIFESERFALPESLEGKQLEVQMTDPLSRLRQAKKGEGFIRTMEMLTPFANADPTILQRFDIEKTTEFLLEMNGAPLKVLKPKEQFEQEQQDAKDAQAGQQAVEGAQGAATALKDAVPALAQAQETGVFDEIAG